MSTDDRLRAAMDEDVTLFVGNPERCVGLLKLRNPHDEPLRVRNVALREAREIETAIPCGPLKARVATRLSSGETKLVTARLALPPGTPPGRYRATLAADADRPIEIDVHELRRTRIIPSNTTVQQAAGGEFELSVIAANLGNVPVLIPSYAALELHEGEHGWPTHFHAAARAHGNAGSAALLDAFAERLARSEPGVGRVAVEQGAGELPAQQTRPLRLRITLPAKLRARGKFLAVARLADAKLHLTVFVAARDGDSNHDEANS